MASQYGSPCARSESLGNTIHAVKEVKIHYGYGLSILKCLVFPVRGLPAVVPDPEVLVGRGKGQAGASGKSAKTALLDQIFK